MPGVGAFVSVVFERPLAKDCRRVDSYILEPFRCVRHVFLHGIVLMKRGTEEMRVFFDEFCKFKVWHIVCC